LMKKINILIASALLYACMKCTILSRSEFVLISHKIQNLAESQRELKIFFWIVQSTLCHHILTI